MSSLSKLSHDYLTHRNFLTPYQKIWDNEVLNTYPESLLSYPQEWLETLLPLEEDDLHKVDALISFKPIEGSSLFSFCQELSDLTQRPHLKKIHESLPIAAFDKMNDKKEYEIRQISPFIAELASIYKASEIVDIGSGVGNLSRLLSSYYHLKTICIEKEDFFKSQGEKYAEQFGKNSVLEKMTFKNLSLSEASFENLDFITPESFIVGLHTCGNLSNHLLELSQKKRPKIILNFPCCYLLLDPQQDLNLSSVAKENPFYLSKHGLTLAARFRAGFSIEEFRLKYRAKSFRYALHLFLSEELGMKEFVSVGDSKVADYQKNFSFYAQKKLKKLKIEKKFTDNTLDQFYNDKNFQALFHKMFLCNTMRGFFGRALENTILLDRSAYLEEQGYQVTLECYFDETKSPRNRGILGIRHD